MISAFLFGMKCAIALAAFIFTIYTLVLLAHIIWGWFMDLMEKNK
jgi:hypothetical protein